MELNQYPQQVIVYSQANCQPCKATKRKLDQLGVPYSVVDVDDNPDALAYLQREGWQGTPVVEVKPDTALVVAAWQGYKVGALTALAKGEEEMAAYDMRRG